jgi:hypothetical protein
VTAAYAKAPCPRTNRRKQACDLALPEDRLRPGRGFAAAVAVDGSVRGEQREQTIDVAVVDGFVEASGEHVALLARGLESWPALVDLAPCPGGELAAVLLALADDGGDLSVVVVEDVVEQEDRPLHR